MNRFRTAHSALAVVSAALLAACAAPPLAPPQVELPAMTATAPANLDRWWVLFDDPQLSALIDEALVANHDLRAAVARIEEARASLQLARAALYPSLDGQAGVNRNRVSNANTRQLPPPLATTTYSAGMQASYEVDVWDRLASGRDAAASTLMATRYAAETVRIALAAQVATTYFTLRTLDADLRLTRATVQTREENVRLLKKRRDAGLASDFEYKIAEAERATVATAIAPLERAIAVNEAALATLAGRSAKAVFTPDVARASMAIDARTPEVPAGLPSDLLARRPDIRQAEAQLAATEARIAEARALYYPRLTLTASLGGESAELADLLTSPARVWSIAGGLLQPLIGLNQIRSQVDAATARRQQAVIGYQQAVQSAFRDAHDALVAHRSARDAYASQRERHDKLRDAMKLAELRHANGYSSYLEVLDAQRNLLDAERAQLNALRDRQVALVDLYKALGGGWSPPTQAAIP